MTGEPAAKCHRALSGFHRDVCPWPRSRGKGHPQPPKWVGNPIAFVDVPMETVGFTRLMLVYPR